MSNNFWSDEELNILKQYYPTEGIKGVHKRLPHRSESSIRGRASKLGIGVNKRRSDIAWKEEELNILRTYYGLEGPKGCKERGLNRSLYSIKGVANKLGLVHKPENYHVGRAWTDEEDDVVRTYYAVEGADSVAKRLNRTKTAVHKRAGFLKVTRKNNPKVTIEGEGYWTPKEVALLRKHYPYGGSRACIENGIKRSATEICLKAKYEGIRCEFTDVRESNYTMRDNMWSKAEVEYLESTYKEGGLNAVKKGLNRSDRSILGKVTNEGLKVDKTDTMWTDEELEILKRYYKTEGRKGCKARGINKTEKSIAYKAEMLGLTEKRVPWTSEEEAIILKYYVSEGAKGCKARGINKTEKAIMHRATKLGIKWIKGNKR